MKILKILVILFLSLGFSQLKSDEKKEELKNKILKNVRCLICQGQSVYDSESDFAFSIKLIVEKNEHTCSHSDISMRLCVPTMRDNSPTTVTCFATVPDIFLNCG